MPIKSKGRGKAPKNQHQLCQPLPSGEVLTDLKKKPWKLGEALGSGGFGLIYTADESSKATVKANANYVIKVEPHGNGPLFSEIAFYLRVAKSELIEGWRKQKKLSFVPIPPYIAHGLHNYNGDALRFLVMPRFGSDLHQLWLKANKKFKRETVAKIAILMLDALEYIHSKDYVHADIKGANILCGDNNSKQLFLVDYGLAYRYIVNDEHKEYKPDPRKAHNGTIEYTSTDAHDGANPSRRGDIEILGFYLLHLLCGQLPWEDKLSDCNYVRDAKKKHLKNPESLVKSTCGTSIPEVSKLLQQATKLDYDEKPNYDQMRALFKDALKSLSVSQNSSFDFSNDERRVSFNEASPVAQKKSKPQKRKIVTPHPSKTKSRKKAALPSSTDADDDDSSIMEDNSVPKTSSGRRRNIPRQNVATTSSCSDESSPFVVKSRSLRQGKPVVLETNTDEPDSSEDFNVDFSKPVKSKQKLKAASARKTRAKQQRRDSNSENEAPANVQPLKLPKPQRPPITIKPRTSPRRKELLKPQSPLSSDSDGDESIDGPDTSESEVMSPAKRTRTPRSGSRHSMAPLHTQPVLTENDKLTGKYSGKHPVFLRRKKNVEQMDASTQTTPRLRKASSRK